MTIKKRKRPRPTPRQLKAAHSMIMNAISSKPLSTGQVLESVGYGSGLVHNPHRVLRSEGFQVAMEEMGLKEALNMEGVTPQKISQKINVLLDARNGDQDDYQAIDKGLKHATAIHGITQDREPATKNTYNIIFSPEVQARVHDINENIKSILIKGNDKEN